jgi:NADP-dependent 3-hydroxy acid dehydrogenase YdfG
MGSKTGLRIFKGATAIITGGASGIGKALAMELARRGCEVILADVQYELAKEAATQIKSRGGKASAKKVDVRDCEAVKAMVEETVRRTGRLDYMFNNAGASIGGEVKNYSIDDWNLVIDINLRGVTNGIQAAYPVMLKQGFGQIVNTSSMAGLVPTAGNTVYSATKYAVVGLSQSLRFEAALYGTPILDYQGEFSKSYLARPQLADVSETMRPISPELFARKVLPLIVKNKAIIVVPWSNRLAIGLARVFPGITGVVARMMIKKYTQR